MAGEPIVTYVGNVTADPELRFLASGKGVCNFTLAVNHRVKKGDSWEDGPTTWVRCTVWEEFGENVVESIKKGNRVIVQGKQFTQEYETKEGEKRSSLCLTVDAVGPDLRFATASVTRAQRAGGGSGGGGAQRSAEPPQNDPWATPSGADNEPPF